MPNMPHWISLIIRRFGKKSNLSGEEKPLEAVVIPTVTMIAEWAKDDRDDICQVWVFGSAISHEDWDSLNDDLDILLVVPDDKWTHKTSHDLPREVPLSEHYLKLDVRVCKESTYIDCEHKINGSPSTASDDDVAYPAIIEYALKTGVCVWKRD